MHIILDIGVGYINVTVIYCDNSQWDGVAVPRMV